MTEAKSVTAIFQPNRVQLETHKQGSGTGIITSSSGGIDCGPKCTATLDEGTNVTLTATPVPGPTFTGWSGGGCFGTGACKVTLAENTSVTVTFTKIPPEPPRHETTQTGLIPAPAADPSGCPAASVIGSVKGSAKRLKCRLGCPADDPHPHLRSQPTEALWVRKVGTAATGCAITREGQDRLRRESPINQIQTSE